MLQFHPPPNPLRQGRGKKRRGFVSPGLALSCPYPLAPFETFEFLLNLGKSSFRRKPESSLFKISWIPAFAGMTKWDIFQSSALMKKMIPVLLALLWVLATVGVEAAAPAPEETSFTFARSLLTTFIALRIAAEATIAVPCWSS